MISILVCLSYNFYNFRYQKVLIKWINNGPKCPLYHKVDLLLHRKAYPKPGEMAHEKLEAKVWSPETGAPEPTSSEHGSTSICNSVILWLDERWREKNHSWMASLVYPVVNNKRPWLKQGGRWGPTPEINLQPPHASCGMHVFPQHINHNTSHTWERTEK